MSRHAPDDLSPRAVTLWRYAWRRGYRSPSKLLMVELALRALDRAEAARTLIDRDGIAPASPGGKMAHAHPALKVEAEARREFLRMWVALELDRDDELDAAFG